jgi:hypothetical protein
MHPDLPLLTDQKYPVGSMCQTSDGKVFVKTNTEWLDRSEPQHVKIKKSGKKRINPKNFNIHEHDPFSNTPLGTEPGNFIDVMPVEARQRNVHQFKMEARIDRNQVMHMQTDPNFENRIMEDLIRKCKLAIPDQVLKIYKQQNVTTGEIDLLVRIDIVEPIK